MVNRIELYQWLIEYGELVGFLSNNGNEHAAKIRGIYNEYVYPNPVDSDGWILLENAIESFKEWQKKSGIE